MPKATEGRHRRRYSLEQHNPQQDEFGAFVAAYAKRHQVSRQAAAKQLRRFFGGFNSSLGVGQQMKIPDYFWSNGHARAATVKYCVVRKVGKDHLTVSLG
jgi:hypothetical protein